VADGARGVPIHAVDPAGLRARRDELVAVLADAVDDGASVGYVLPHDRDEYARHWDEVARAAEAGECTVLVAERDGRIVGTVQLTPCGKPNGRHRAEVRKLLVLRSARGAGIGAALMREVEALAARQGHRLLLLDTRADSAAARLYARLGWQTFGTVPDYALDPDGTPADCVFFHKRCGEAIR
jgi:GNAT superfamily N-acetyltransferase